MRSRVTEKDQWHGIGKMINFMLDWLIHSPPSSGQDILRIENMSQKCLNASLHCLKHFNSILLLSLYVWQNIEKKMLCCFFEINNRLLKSLMIGMACYCKKQDLLRVSFIEVHNFYIFLILNSDAMCGCQISC